MGGRLGSTLLRKRREIGDNNNDDGRERHGGVGGRQRQRVSVDV